MAEAEIMIADSSCRGLGLGWEAMLLMLRYGTEKLGLTKYVAKIKEENQPSLKMFSKNSESCVVGGVSKGLIADVRSLVVTMFVNVIKRV